MRVANQQAIAISAVRYFKNIDMRNIFELVSNILIDK